MVFWVVPLDCIVVGCQYLRGCYCIHLHSDHWS